MTNLGFAYETGRGVAKNDSEAVRWYRAAAEAGNARAMNNLGLMLNSGRGGARNTIQAALWLLAAERAGLRWFRENPKRLRRETRIEVQRLLRDAGHYSGALDGNIGPASRAALDAYIAKKKAASGNVDPNDN